MRYQLAIKTLHSRRDTIIIITFRVHGIKRPNSE